MFFFFNVKYYEVNNCCSISFDILYIIRGGTDIPMSQLTFDNLLLSYYLLRTSYTFQIR